MNSTRILAADVWDCLFERKQKPFPDDQVIFKSGPDERTYSNIRSDALSFGANLQVRLGWKKDDVLLVFSPNHIDIPLVYWGCHWAGGVVSPANPTYTAEELEYQLADSGAKALVIHPSLVKVATAAAYKVGLPVSNIWVVGAQPSEPGLGHVQSILASKTVGEIRPRIDPATDTAFLVYSSGTTGRPKGTLVTHTNIVANMTMQGQVDGPFMDWRKDRVLAVIPTYHIFGLMCLFHVPVFMGLQTIIVEKYSISSFLRDVYNESITNVYVAPPIVLHLAKDPAMTRARLSSLRMVTSGGAPLPPGLIRAVHDRLKIPVRQAFGLTESTAISHTQRWDKWNHAIGSNGPPLPGVEVKFINGRGDEVQGEGELCLRGPTIFLGYRNNAEDTKKSITPDKWFMTGDIGYQDEESNLFLTDRLKDLIKYKGFQIPPAEIESVLHTHPFVHDVAVVGVFGQAIASEVPIAYVVLNEGTEGNQKVAEELIEYVAQKLAPHKRLRGGVIWVDEIPKGPSGKILKRVLKHRIEEMDRGKAVGAVVYEDISSKL
ncbi:uncharacterized protein N7511_005916 [Penicillium nucicola]|uniref:uncharacterized protein n=1 Tax=Penicillium nucicola TaxID=1850975 RepID=UPI00254572A1|nr:uncharacterized protein N7511_005916 [Penicillium nucicola]KAJ5762534.1 hypothetical protein N7511_005916 [Penicillium nucicola]